MSEEKQIEEIYEILCAVCIEDCKQCKYSRDDMCIPHSKAEKLYEAGYRKPREGEWVDQYQGKYDNQLYKCSECEDTAFHDDKRWFLTPFCPNCGAKMKGGEG